MKAAGDVRPFGVSAISAFFFFGMLMAGLAAFLLAHPGTVLDSLWRVNPEAQQDLGSIGFWGIYIMANVAIACAYAAIGLWRCKRWGFLVAVYLLAGNAIADLGNAVYRHDWRSLIGVPIAGAMLFYLIATKRAFKTSA